MRFGRIMWNENMEKKQNYITWIQTKDVETRLDTSKYKLKRSLPREKNKKAIGLMKNVLD